jgi:hypothetical protein
MQTPEQTTALTPAEKYYQAHLKNVSKYQKNNPEKMRAKNKRHNDKIKNEDPEKYQAKLLKQREYYQTVIKPKAQSSKKTEEPAEELSQ